jgi:hypothetical protein
VSLSTAERRPLERIRSSSQEAFGSASTRHRTGTANHLLDRIGLGAIAGVMHIAADSEFSTPTGWHSGSERVSDRRFCLAGSCRECSAARERRRGPIMTITYTNLRKFHKILEEKEAKLFWLLQSRDDIQNRGERGSVDELQLAANGAWRFRTELSMSGDRSPPMMKMGWRKLESADAAR